MNYHFPRKVSIATAPLFTHDFESWQKAELSSPVKKRKREESSEEGEAKRRRFGEIYFSAEKHYEW